MADRPRAREKTLQLAYLVLPRAGTLYVATQGDGGPGAVLVLVLCWCQ